MADERSTQQRFSYDIEALDASSELSRLERQVEAVREIEWPYLRRIPLEPDGVVVDLGCGPGIATEALASLVPSGRVIGVDTAPGLLAQARSRFASRGLRNARFVEGRADRIPLADRTADLVYARFLFQHLRDPGLALREIQRVLRPGGWVLILDTDDGSLLVHPEPEGFARLLDASLRSQAAVGGDRHVGRKLRELLVRAGFDEVEVVLQPFTSDMVGMEAFLEIVVGYKRQIIDPDLMPPDEVRAVLGRLAALDPRAGAFAQTCGYAGSGRVPTGERQP